VSAGAPISSIRHQQPKDCLQPKASLADERCGLEFRALIRIRSGKSHCGDVSRKRREETSRWCDGHQPAESGERAPRYVEVKSLSNAACYFPPPLAHRRWFLKLEFPIGVSHGREVAIVCRAYSNANTRFQSLFMSTTVHLFRAAASKAVSSFPK